MPTTTQAMPRTALCRHVPALEIDVQMSNTEIHHLNVYWIIVQQHLIYTGTESKKNLIILTTLLEKVLHILLISR